MKYKVLRIINRFNIGGPTYNVAYLTKYLHSDFDTQLLGGVHDKGEQDSLYMLEALGLNPTVIKMERSIHWKKDLKAYKEIRKIIREYQPDIVHTHASKAGALGRLAASKEGVPVIVHTFHGHVFHSYFGSIKTRFFKSVERYLAKKSTQIVAISQEQKKELTEIHKICDPDKMTIIPLGFDLSMFKENSTSKRAAFREKYKLNENEIAIGIIGRLAPVKNHSLFVESIHQLIKNSSTTKIKAFIIGDGTERESIENTIAQLPQEIQQSFTLTSWIKNIDEAIAGLDIVALTSLNEGTPVSLIEAQAGGKPVVSTKVGGVIDVVKNEESGYISQNLEPKSFSILLKKLCESTELREKMGTAGQEWVHKYYSFERLVEDTEQMYRKLLKET